ncbi:MAG: permease-like cell division protein FtsX [Acidiferrobacterales bacterium]
MSNHLLRHLQAALFSLGQMMRTPLASLMTIAVIGIALALPSGLYVMIDNMLRVSNSWDTTARISIFLKMSVPEDRVKYLASRIEKIPAVASVEYVSPKAALEEFKRLSGFGETLSALDNPLPAVILVTPRSEAANDKDLQSLVLRLKKNSEVDLVQLDLQWVRRLNALLEIARRGATLLGVVLAAAVLLIIGNTIRLMVFNRRDEIEVIKLVGGTNAFIRRPFLYSGVYQGLFGALAAWGLVGGSLALLQGPITNLALLYGSDFSIRGLTWQTSGALLLSGAFLGWLGSRIAVGRHLSEIEPS